jgi:hypothetical protein
VEWANEAKREARVAINAAKRDAKREELHLRTMAQLQALCAQHGLSKTGVKAELVARLCDALCTDEQVA